MEFIYPGLPPSKNLKKIRTASGQEVKPPELKLYEEQFDLTIQYDSRALESFLQRYGNGKGLLVKFTLQLYDNNQRSDIINYIDFFADAMQRLLGINDRYFFFELLPLLYSDKPYMKITADLYSCPFKKSKANYKATRLTAKG